MNDWKPGDRFTIEFEMERVAHHDVPYPYVTSDGYYLHADAMARAVKPPPKARPVRKGDRVKPESAAGPVTFLATWNNQVVIWRDGYGSDVYGKQYVTHADGAEIDWEASE